MLKILQSEGKEASKIKKKMKIFKDSSPIADLMDLQMHTHSPDAAVLTADSSILAGGVYTHVVQGGLPHHVVRTPELCSSVSLRSEQKHCGGGLLSL